jgi:hypothetical protein
MLQRPGTSIQNGLVCTLPFFFLSFHLGCCSCVICRKYTPNASAISHIAFSEGGYHTRCMKKCSSPISSLQGLWAIRASTHSLCSSCLRGLHARMVFSTFPFAVLTLTLSISSSCRLPSLPTIGACMNGGIHPAGSEKPTLRRSGSVRKTSSRSVSGRCGQTWKIMMTLMSLCGDGRHTAAGALCHSDTAQDRHLHQTSVGFRVQCKVGL